MQLCVIIFRLIHVRFTKSFYVWRRLKGFTYPMRSWHCKGAKSPVESSQFGMNIDLRESESGSDLYLSLWYPRFFWHFDRSSQFPSMKPRSLCLHLEPSTSHALLTTILAASTTSTRPVKTEISVSAKYLQFARFYFRRNFSSRAFFFYFVSFLFCFEQFRHHSLDADWRINLADPDAWLVCACRFDWSSSHRCIIAYPGQFLWKQPLEATHSYLHYIGFKVSFLV